MMDRCKDCVHFGVCKKGFPWADGKGGGWCEDFIRKADYAEVVGGSSTTNYLSEMCIDCPHLTLADGERRSTNGMTYREEYLHRPTHDVKLSDIDPKDTHILLDLLNKQKLTECQRIELKRLLSAYYNSQ